ncbi:toll-like receptor 2 isoform X2 [Boleophthalmus pectinirostris]|uniref:toll-like receptor 2 isoform X2 n=1 Tax=Boleophthalmus pectinirostris TaxID=150288 RepID=UPI00242B4410|nr:toll-like receptor 2 isoform X2 [Boleophthalmus pectinirostris]
MPCVWALFPVLAMTLSSAQNLLGDRSPQSCRCDQDLDCTCSHSGLSSVPSVPDQTRTLDLNYNQITEIHSQDLGPLRELLVLKMHANRLSQIDPQAFSGLWNLKELDLSQNLLTTLDHRWFNKLGALESLKLHSNLYKCLGSPPPFQTLVRLRVLSFGGESLEEIRVSDLRGVGGLKQLLVDANNLKRYDSGALAQIWPLDHVTLGLHSPFLLNQTLASAVLHDVSYPQTHLTLDNISMSTNLSVLPFREVAQKRVSWEKAHKTDHKSLDEIFIKDIVVLNVFEFRSFLPLGFILEYPRKISVINAKVFVMPCFTAFLLKNLMFLDLSENLLTDPTLTETLCEGAGVLKNLRVLNISANAIKSLSLISRMVSHLSKLSHLDVSRNTLNSMPPSCPWPQSLRFLNMSRTKLSNATSCLPPTLQVLDLSYNDLEELSVELPALKELHLSGNKLLTLPPGSLYPNLQTLTIQINTLNFFSHSDLLSFPRLQNFQAGLNKFICSCDFVPFFHSLSSGKSNVSLTDEINNYFCDSPLHLQGTPLSLVHRSFPECHYILFVALSCGLVLVFLVCLGAVLWKMHAFWYLNMIFVWLKAKHRRRRRERMRREDRDTDRLLVTYDAFVSYSERDSAWVDNYLIPELEQTESGNGGVEMTKGNYGTFCHQPVSMERSSEETRAESSSGASWDTRPESSPRPEPLRLCLHRRDFLPGRWIMDNIVTAIESSHRTLFILSHNFVKSDWCKYELDFTHFQLLEGNCREDAAILVLLEPLHHDDVPKRFCRLRRLLNSTTYLQWPQDPDQRDQRDQFWTSLRQALRPVQDLD